MTNETKRIIVKVKYEGLPAGAPDFYTTSKRRKIIMSKLFIGWSEVNITPDKKISLAGQFAERISEYVEKPLTATAMAVEAEGEQMVLVSTDLVVAE